MINSIRLSIRSGGLHLFLERMIGFLERGGALMFLSPIVTRTHNVSRSSLFSRSPHGGTCSCHQSPTHEAIVLAGWRPLRTTAQRPRWQGSGRSPTFLIPYSRTKKVAVVGEQPAHRTPPITENGVVSDAESPRFESAFRNVFRQPGVVGGRKCQGRGSPH